MTAFGASTMPDNPMRDFVARHVAKTVSVTARPARHQRLGGLRSAAAVLGMLLAALPAGPVAEPLPDQVKVNMGIWFRRDWDNCESATNRSLEITMQAKSCS